MKQFDFYAGFAMLIAVTVVMSCSDNSGDVNALRDSEYGIGDSDDTGSGRNADAESDHGTDTDTATATISGTESDTETGGVDMPAETRSAVAWNSAPDISDDDYRRFVDNTNCFGFSLFRQFTHDEENVVFSPVSIATALGMAFAGAAENTKDEMSQALQNDLSDSDFHSAANRLLIELAGRNISPHESAHDNGEKEVQLSLVNGVFAQQNYAIESSFLDVLALNYDSGVRLLDFANSPNNSRLAINEWVADNTNRKIEDLIPEGGITEDTQVVLSNALYFYGSWQDSFMVERTHDDAFYTLGGAEIPVPTMTIETSFDCGESDGFQIIDIPYDGNALVMTIVLPDPGQFQSIRDQADAAWLAEATQTMSRAERVLSVPEFSFSYGSISLKELLESLGMHDAFDKELADFSGIHHQPEEKLFISDVVHKSFIGIDEYGTEAAAATAVIMPGFTSVPPAFRIDRPFLFFIRDKASGLILFSGQVVDPS